MSGTYGYGPLRTCEIVWRSGHVETVQGHQVLSGTGWGSAAPGFFPTIPPPCPRLTIHDVTGRERLPC